MGREELTKLKSGVVKRSHRRVVGIFIDGTGVDRASRRLKKKVDLPKLVQVLSQGLPVEVSRYYCLLPNEDDSRQAAYLMAVEKAGLEVLTKRLPPKGVDRMVSVDTLLATDLINFANGYYENKTGETEGAKELKRIVVVVCPSKELNYPLTIAAELGCETTAADFGIFQSSEPQNGIQNVIDLSDSEDVWME